MLKLGRLYYIVGGVDLLSSLRKCNYLFTWNTITKHVAFLIVSSTLSLENTAQMSIHSFLPNELIFTISHICTLANHAHFHFPYNFQSLYVYLIHSQSTHVLTYE